MQASSGALPLKVVKISSALGRGYAYNNGADVAGGDVLLFLRADSLVPPGYDETLRRELSSPNICVTAFKFDQYFGSLTADKPTPISPSALFCLALYQNMLSVICKLPRGSQGLAASADFCRSHRFPDDAILLEDASFVLSVRTQLLRQGQVQGLKVLEQSVLSSAEEAATVGVLKHTFINVLAFSLRCYLGVSDEAIYRWCYVRIPKCLQRVNL